MLHRLMLVCFVVACAFHASSQVTITLRKSFIDSFKNKVTIASDYAVYYAHEHPNAAENDGDLHFAGYDTQIGLPVVAEVMNAKDQPEALTLIHEKEGKGKPDETVKLTGAWRLWSEHIQAGVTYKQGMGDKSIKNTNPNHVFEIHPATKIEDIDLTASLTKITGYTPYTGKKAFDHYLNIQSGITSTAKTISIKTKGARYNYAQFWIKLNSTEKYEVADGLFVYCTILDSKFKPGKSEQTYFIHGKIRVAFVLDSEPYNEAKPMKKGEYLHVLAIPRISLNEISWRVRRAASNPGGLTDNIPVEMIVVGIID